ncbi:MAG TPA: bifunctional transaldolase/phosoglucose isomerase [Candidatus Binatia bacterium]|nr:bifunctional transaldolase/phosoglucose isomerase [Candidatus Binatia bacterium]
MTGETSLHLPGDLETAVRGELDAWRAEDTVRRLWARDASLWTGADEASWLGWLGVAGEQLGRASALRDLAAEARTAGFTHALVLGMGGSSLCPEVLKTTFGRIPGHPELFVLDSTDPAQIQTIEQRIDVANTLFIVSSKSGTTLEPNIFMRYFFDRARQLVGSEHAGTRFMAVTDPGSRMEQVAAAHRFRRVLAGVPSIGGRYSALSDFGMAPAAIMGLDVGRFLGHAVAMTGRCGASVPPAENPGVLLGIVLGVLARRGRDKVTLAASPGIAGLGVWLEQLLAESTGKLGKGLIPVDREPLGMPAVYADDRLFVYVRLTAAADPAQDDAVGALERAGQPVVRIGLGDPYELGGEFFRWEIATAVAGAVLGVNPFDQPDVEASKVATRALTDQYEATGTLPLESPLRADDPAFAAKIGAHLQTVKPGDYVAFLAYIPMNEAHDAELQTARVAVRDRLGVATCVGFGPRYLHSTGQAYKGGPNSGVFVLITCDDADDLPVPGQRYSFGVVKAAQALGDLQVLRERGRRALRVPLGSDVKAGLALLRRAIEA